MFQQPSPSAQPAPIAALPVANRRPHFMPPQLPRRDWKPVGQITVTDQMPPALRVIDRSVTWTLRIEAYVPEQGGIAWSVKLGEEPDANQQWQTQRIPVVGIDDDVVNSVVWRDDRHGIVEYAGPIWAGRDLAGRFISLRPLPSGRGRAMLWSFPGSQQQMLIDPAGDNAAGRTRILCHGHEVGQHTDLDLTRCLINIDPSTDFAYHINRVFLGKKPACEPQTEQMVIPNFCTPKYVVEYQAATRTLGVLHIDGKRQVLAARNDQVVVKHGRPYTPPRIASPRPPNGRLPEAPPVAARTPGMRMVDTRARQR